MADCRQNLLQKFVGKVKKKDMCEGCSVNDPLLQGSVWVFDQYFSCEDSELADNPDKEGLLCNVSASN